MGRSGATGFERVAIESLEQRAVSVDDAGCGEYRLVNAVIGLRDPTDFEKGQYRASKCLFRAS